MMKTVWRFGSNWGQENLLELFYEYKIAFAGEVVSNIIQRIAPGDLICITNGQKIMAIGKVDSLVSLKEVNQVLYAKYDQVDCVKLTDIFLESSSNIDFGIYQGTGKQLHEAKSDYKTHINFLFDRVTEKMQGMKTLEILTNKKQIILQGPPGTGKTRLAKILAKKLVKRSLVNQDIIDSIKVNQEIITSSGSASFKITLVGETSLDYQRNSTGKHAKLNYSDIISAYSSELWLNPKNGSDSYSAGVAKYIYESNLDDVNLIQFHPSYTYEDFVRGIVVNHKDGNVVYKTKNKILAELALEAQENLELSNDYSHNADYRAWVKEKFEIFIQSIGEQLENGPISITEKVDIIGLEDDAFRYKGKTGWTEVGNLMHFKDIIQSYISGDESRQDVARNAELARLAHWHATYYFAVLNLFKQFLSDNNLQFLEAQVVKVERKNFVLIIDEINRANLPSVLGELIYALEYRGEAVESLYDIEGDRSIILPENLFIIGTMNTADRSVGHIDYAIRRRFAFIDVLPDEKTIQFDVAKNYFNQVSELFVNIKDGAKQKSVHLAPDFDYKDVQIGHSYFIVNETHNGEDKKAQLKMKLQFEVLPILREYVRDGLLLESAENKINDLENKIIKEL